MTNMEKIANRLITQSKSDMIRSIGSAILIEFASMDEAKTEREVRNRDRHIGQFAVELIRSLGKSGYLD